MVVRFAAIGIEDKDLLVLKSLLTLVGKAAHVDLAFADDPAQAGVVFLSKLPPRIVADLAAHLGAAKTLVYCGELPETPSGVRVLAHCPPRVNELAALIAALPAPPTTAAMPAAAPSAAAEFSIDDCLAGAIHARIPKLLIDHPLLVTVPDLPPLLVDAVAGVRVIHADAIWFAEAAPWRTSIDRCRLEVGSDRSVLAGLRKHRPRAYMALRFWGVMSASAGRQSEELARAATAGLRRLPDFRQWPHHPWQRALAPAMLTRTATPENWAQESGRARSEIVDFLNAAAAVALLATRKA